MRMITVHLPEPDIKALDSYVERGLYSSRAEAIRFAVKDFLRSAKDVQKFREKLKEKI